MTRSSLGVCATSYLAVWETIDTLDFLDHCSDFGAAGIQAPLHGDPLKIRARAEELEMYVEAMVPLPAEDDAMAFERSLRKAKAAGATALRAACLGTRRYETFKTFREWQAHVERSHRSLAAALPLLEKYKIPLGLENHKDWTANELLAIMQHYSSEYLGVCLDFGNNISVLDSPMEAIEKLAPFTISTHLKDVSADTYEEGILLSEVILGRGHLDLNAVVRLIRQARPLTRMTLEMITREPLKIPMLADEYWATFPDKTALDLARTLRFVHEQKRAEPLPRISHLEPPEIMKREDQNIMDCISVWNQLHPQF